MRGAVTFIVAVLWLAQPAFAGGIIPYPNGYEPGEGELAIPKKISVSSRDREFAALIPGFVRTAEGYFGLRVRRTRGKAFVDLRRNRDIRDPEAYRITVGDGRMMIEAGSPAGCFYGLQSVLQLLADPSGKLKAAVIEDSPRYEWRGLMLDEARHVFGVKEVKSILDLMAIHKLNRFHWHLTDTNGWRVQIRKYPRLAEVGGVGNQTDPAAPARYYTQREVREIVRYARERFIEVVPEIDMPGHAAAAVRAYPQYGGGGPPHDPDFTFNPGKEATYRFLTEILGEVAELFPSRYLHIGGDEVRLGNQQWADLPDVQRLMQEQGLSSLEEVEHFFLRRMAKVVAGLGKTVVVWDEALAAGLPRESTLVMWWRHNRPQVLRETLEKGYPLVMCPRIPLYFDFVQHEAHTDGRKWDRDFVPVESVYRFPALEFTGGIPVDGPLVRGIQANVWTDRMHTPERLQFMIYPRLSALAEAGWTRGDSKDWSSFDLRVQSMLRVFDRRGIRYFNYRSPEEEIPGPVRPAPSVTEEPVREPSPDGE